MPSDRSTCSARNRLRGLLSVSVLSAALVVGCRGRDAPSETGSTPQTTAVAAVNLDIRGVNELLVGGTTIHTALFYYGLFLPLAEEQADYHDGPPSFRPRLAESWEFSDDHESLTFHLRDAVWSDGTPITAEDVRWTWQAQIHPDVAWSWASAKERVTDVEVLDPKTVTFHFSEAYATQLLDAVTGVILPRHVWSELPFEAWRENADWFLEHLVASGPFELEAWEPDQRIVLRRNPRYFDPERPRLDRIVLRVLPDRTSQLALLRSDEAQLVEWVRAADVPALLESTDIELVPYLPRWYTFVMWNTRRPPLDDPAVRTALGHAIDRQTILDTLYLGRGQLDASPFPSNLWVSHPDLEPLAFDQDKAKALLGQAGWTDSDGDGLLDRNGAPLRLEILTNSENEVRRDILVMMQQQLREIGVEMTPTTLEFATVFERAGAGDFDGVFTTLSVDTTLDMSFVFHSSAIENGYNWGGWSNSEMDALLEETRSAVDPLAARPAFLRMQEVLYEEQPIMLLWEQELLVGKHKSLVGVSPNALSVFFDLEEWHFLPASE